MGQTAPLTTVKMIFEAGIAVSTLITIYEAKPLLGRGGLCLINGD